MLATAAHAAGPPTVVFLSDFGTRDDAVAICKGVMLQVEPALRMIDLTHEVTPFAIGDAARLLADTAEHYPPGTVFLAVDRPRRRQRSESRWSRARSAGRYFVLPDNGLVTLVADRQGARRRARDREPALDARRRRARDVPRARRLRARRGAARARRRLDAGGPTDRGSPCASTSAPRQLDGDVIRGTVIATDGPYGNL